MVNLKEFFQKGGISFQELNTLILKGVKVHEEQDAVVVTTTYDVTDLELYLYDFKEKLLWRIVKARHESLLDVVLTNVYISFWVTLENNTEYFVYREDYNVDFTVHANLN